MAISYTLTTETREADDWLSGVYLAKLTGSSQRQTELHHFRGQEDDRPVGVSLQSSVTTFRPGCNNRGGKSTYPSNSRDF